MRVALLNPNTSAFVTDRMVEAAQKIAPPNVSIVGYTAQTGPEIVGTRAENGIAAANALELGSAIGDTAHAIVLGISTDAGLHALREVLHIPVVGVLQAGVLTACQLGERIGLITLGSRMLPLYQEQISAYGLAGKMHAWAAPDIAGAYQKDVEDGVHRAIADQAARMAIDSNLDVIVVAGAVLAGCRTWLERRVPVPVVDSLEAAVHQALGLAASKYPKQTIGSFSTPPARKLTGEFPSLRAVLAREHK
jgi:allantoin racemase